MPSASRKRRLIGYFARETPSLRAGRTRVLLLGSGTMRERAHARSRGFHYRPYPTSQQETRLRQTAGVCRPAYDLALEQRRDHGHAFKRQTGKAISYTSQAREMTALRAEIPWILAVSQTMPQQTLRDLDRAYRRFYRGEARYPRPRLRGEDDSARYAACDEAQRDVEHGERAERRRGPVPDLARDGRTMPERDGLARCARLASELCVRARDRAVGPSRTGGRHRCGRRAHDGTVGRDVPRSADGAAARLGPSGEAGATGWGAWTARLQAQRLREDESRVDQAKPARVRRH